MKRIRGALICIISLLTFSNPSTAQTFDPRPTLGIIIQGFQTCGPPAAFLLLSPAVYQTVYFQTNGSGCYPAIRSAGPVQNMQIVDHREFPLGPLYVVRVTHPTGSVDWFVGFNRLTSKVEYLNFQPAQGQAPTITSGPTSSTGSNGPASAPAPAPSPNPDAGCKLYPAMCQ